MTKHTEDIRQALEKYARIGWSIIAVERINGEFRVCGRGTDGPLIWCGRIGHPFYGIQHATDDFQLLRKAWQEYPESGIGLALGGITSVIALNVIPDRGGSESLTALEHEYGPLPVTLEVQSPDGSRQLIFWLNPTNCPVGRRLIALGLEVVGQGEFIILPPSTTGDGRQYAWATGRSLDDIGRARLLSGRDSLLRKIKVEGEDGE